MARSLKDLLERVKGFMSPQLVSAQPWNVPQKKNFAQDQEGWFRGGKFTPTKQVNEFVNKQREEAWKPTGIGYKTVMGARNLLGTDQSTAGNYTGTLSNIKRFQLPSVDTPYKGINLAGNLVKAIPESVINIPRNIVTGSARMAQEYDKSKNEGRKMNLLNLAQGAGPWAEGIFDMATLGGSTLAKDLIKQGGKQTIKNALIKQGTKGAVVGGFGGLTYGLDSQYGKKFDPLEVGTSVAGGTVLGGVLGGAMGVAPAVLNTVKNAYRKIGLDEETAKVFAKQHFVNTENKPITLRQPKAQKEFWAKINKQLNRPSDTPVYLDEVKGLINKNNNLPDAQLSIGMQTKPKGGMEAIKQADLLSEARKYKSAEEFVRAQGETVYHGSKDLQKLQESGLDINKNIFVTKDKNYATGFGDVTDFVLPKNSKIKTVDNLEISKDIFSGKNGIKNTTDLFNSYKKDGFDAVEIVNKDLNHKEIVVLNPSVLRSKFQLTDIYNQATKQIDPIEALKAEARKYKSAEEFVRAQGEPIYHGTRDKIDNFDLNHLNATYMHDGLGINFTDKKDFAQLYSRGKNEWGEIKNIDDNLGYVHERYIKGGNVLDLTSGSKNIGDIVSQSDFEKLASYGRDKEWARNNLERLVRNSFGSDVSSREATKIASEMSDKELVVFAYNKLKDRPMTSGEGLPDFFRQLIDLYGVKDSDKADVVKQFSKLTGYDYIKTPKESGSNVFTVLNPDKLYTKSQLTDIYNQAKVTKDMANTARSYGVNQIIGEDDKALADWTATQALSGGKNVVKHYEKVRDAGKPIPISSVYNQAKGLTPEVTTKSVSNINVEKQAEKSGILPDISDVENALKQGKITIDEATSLLGNQFKERKFITSIHNSENVIPEVKNQTQSLYKIKHDDQLMGEAEALLQDGASIDWKNTQDLDIKVAATIKQAISSQKTDPQAAANLFNNLSEHGTELGRAVQAYSMLPKMSPEAIALSVAGRIKKFNASHSTQIPELNGEQVKLISDKVMMIDLLKGRDKNIALHELETTINSFIPSSLADKATAVWKAGLLTSLRTHERNFVGNAIHGVAEIVKDVPATLADQFMSARTGQRTVTPTLRGVEEFVSKKTGQQVADIVSMGYDPERVIDKFDYKSINWGNNKIEQALKKYTDVVFRTLGAEDKPFYNAAMARSLYDQAGAEAINAGRRGDKVFIENLIKNPTERMIKTAINDANVATFKTKNTASSVATAIKRELGKTWYTKIAGEITLPFTGVPSSILGQIIQYSPVGLLKGIAKVGKVSIKNLPELQRQAAQELGRGVIGTGVYALGAYLYSKGLITGQPKDAAEQRQWDLENKPRNSIMIGGKWRSLNSIGPEAIVFLAGSKLTQELGKSDGNLGSYAWTLGKDFVDQSFLTGLQAPVNALTDPVRYGKSYLGQLVSSPVPNIVKDLAKATDPYARETNTVGDYFTQSLPFLRNTLPARKDVLGNNIPQQPTGFGAFVDLFNSKTPISNPVVDELSRLNTGGNNATPSKLANTQTINGAKTKLTPQELDTLESIAGKEVSNKLTQLIASPSYQALSDEDKANAIDSVVQKTRKTVKATIDLKNDTFDTVNSSTGGQYMLINKETGSVKNIDLSTPIEYPTLTGNSIIDKKLISSYKSDLNSRLNDVIALYKDGQITLSEVEKYIGEIQSKYKSSSDGGSKKIKVSEVDYKSPKLPTIKFKKPAAIKFTKGPVSAKTTKTKPKNITITKKKHAKIAIKKFKNTLG